MTLRTELRDGVLWLTLDRPAQLNAFTADSYHALATAIERAGEDPDTRAVVLTGDGRAFSAGADRSLVDGTAAPEERGRAGVEFHAMLDALQQCDTPIFAAVNGVAVGIGCTILLHCDFVLMAESARLRLPFTALGVAPEAGSSVLLPERARWGDAAWSMLSSEWITSETAREMGLAWRVVPDDQLLAETEQAAATIAALDPASVAATKRLLVSGRADLARAAIERELAEWQRLGLG